MRIYLPSTHAFLSGGVDMAERWLRKNHFPRVLSATRCDETSAILVDFANGATLEIESGARHYLTGVALDSTHNAKSWVAMARHDYMLHLRESIARALATMESESGEALKAMQEQVDRYNRTLALVSGAAVSLRKAA